MVQPKRKPKRRIVESEEKKCNRTKVKHKKRSANLLRQEKNLKYTSNSLNNEKQCKYMIKTLSEELANVS